MYNRGGYNNNNNRGAYNQYNNQPNQQFNNYGQPPPQQHQAYNNAPPQQFNNNMNMNMNQNQYGGGFQMNYQQQNNRNNPSPMMNNNNNMNMNPNMNMPQNNMNQNMGQNMNMNMNMNANPYNNNNPNQFNNNNQPMSQPHNQMNQYQHNNNHPPMNQMNPNQYNRPLPQQQNRPIQQQQQPQPHSPVSPQNQYMPPQQQNRPIQQQQQPPSPKKQQYSASPKKSETKPLKTTSKSKGNRTREYDYLFKLVLIGDATVGKTSLLLRFADDSFKDNYISTIGVDFRFRTLTINDELVKLQIWDTAGQERFRTITSAYYRGSDGVIMVYDITNASSFDHVQDWLDEVHKVAGSSIPKLIIGNKNDLQHKRQVDSIRAQQYALGIGASIIECSAKSADNVDKSFTMIAQELVKRGGVSRKSVSLQRANDDGDKKKGCCSII